MRKFIKVMEKHTNVTANELADLLSEYGEEFNVVSIERSGVNSVGEIPSRVIEIKVTKNSELELKRSKLKIKIDEARIQLRMLEEDLISLNE